MEALGLSKFEDSRLSNLHVIKGGETHTILNHNDGNQYQDADDGTGCVVAVIGDDVISWPSGGGDTGGC